MPVNGNRVAVRLGGWAYGARELAGLHVLHVQAPFSPLATGRLIRQLPKSVGLVATFHSTARDPSATRALRLLARAGVRSARRVDAAVAVSPCAAQTTLETHGLRCEVIGPVVPAHQLDRPASSAARQVSGRILFVGRLVARKGALELVRALAHLEGELPPWHLHMVGDGPQRRALQRELRRSGQQRRVQVLGALPARELQREMAEALVLCAPSLGGESFGLVLLEAMAAGAVALGGNNAGHQHLLGSGQTADVRDLERFGCLLSTCLVDGPVREQALRRPSQHLRVLRDGAELRQLLAIYRLVMTQRARRDAVGRDLPPDSVTNPVSVDRGSVC